jgi:hypothetical protein
MKVQLTRARVSVVTVHPTVTASGEESTATITRSIQAWANHPAARDLPTHRWGNAAGPAADAVLAKAELLRRSAADLILVILYDFREYSEGELPEMRSAVGWALRKAATAFEASFREVWAEWKFNSQEGEAHRLWPAPIGTDVPPLVPGTGTPTPWESTNQAADLDGIVHVVRFRTWDGLCRAYLVGDSREAEPVRCPECDLLLREGMTNYS